ncbi:MAG: hypothetical protein ACOCX2_13270 [Armatimonadota bacterium]
MRTLPIVRATICLTLLAIAVVAMTGCSGDPYDDDYYYDDRHYYDDHHYDTGSYEKTLFVYLNIGDQDGEPLEGATVWVDSRQQEERSDDEYRRLGEQFPPDWAGWRYNWSGGPYWIDLRDCSGYICDIEIVVSKSGYETQRTTVPMRRDDPDEIYMRQTFVMERQVGSAALGNVIDAPQPPEMISLTDPQWEG